MPDQSDETVMQARGIQKAYGHVVALEGVDIDIRRGEIMAIVGDNGAGKSTLIKILSGAVKPDAGTIEFLGEKIQIRSPADARHRGIETVYQDLALAPNRDVTENLFLGREICRGGMLSTFKLLDRGLMRRRAIDQLAQLEIGLPKTTGLPVDRMSGGQRQAVAIARAALWASKVMFMDEPTAALGVRESQAALTLARRVAETGVAIVMISHVMPHVTEFADRVVVLRHGKKVAEVGTGTSTEELVGLIVGARMAETDYMSDAGQVVTVLGAIPPEEVGICSPHEHLLVDVRDTYWRLPEEQALREFALEPIEITNLYLLRRHFVQNRENLVLDDLDLAVAELKKFRELGGRTIVDVTPADVGRDPNALAEASRRSGLSIVAGCGYYVHLAHRPGFSERSRDEIAEEMIRDLEEGIDGTAIRAGIIGEIGTSHPLHPDEEKVLRAAARAQTATGAALTVHLHPPSRAGLAIVDVLDDAGADLSRVVLGHVDIALGHLDTNMSDVLEYHAAMAGRGCYIEYDTCGFPDAYMPRSDFYGAFWFPSDRERAEAIASLFDRGLGDRLLIAQDVCHKHHLTRYGGYGYGHILREFVGTLSDYGLGEGEISQLLISNPARMLARAS